MYRVVGIRYLVPVKVVGSAKTAPNGPARQLAAGDRGAALVARLGPAGEGGSENVPAFEQKEEAMSSLFTYSTPFAGKPMAQRALFVASILTLGALGMPAAADTLDGSEFVEAMKDNTIVGKSASGVPYHLYFVEGG